MLCCLEEIVLKIKDKMLWYFKETPAQCCGIQYKNMTWLSMLIILNVEIKKLNQYYNLKIGKRACLVFIKNLLSNINSLDLQILTGI